jgi:hypothetical protein
MKAIAAGPYNTCVIAHGGDVAQCWGANFTQPPASGSIVESESTRREREEQELLRFAYPLSNNFLYCKEATHNFDSCRILLHPILGGSVDHGTYDFETHHKFSCDAVTTPIETPYVFVASSSSFSRPIQVKSSSAEEDNFHLSGIGPLHLETQRNISGLEFGTNCRLTVNRERSRIFPSLERLGHLRDVSRLSVRNLQRDIASVNRARGAASALTEALYFNPQVLARLESVRDAPATRAVVEFPLSQPILMLRTSIERVETATGIARNAATVPSVIQTRLNEDLQSLQESYQTARASLTTLDNLIDEFGAALRETQAELHTQVDSVRGELTAAIEAAERATTAPVP